MARNGFEYVARANKVRRLVAELDKLCADAGRHPVHLGDRVAEMLERWEDDKWHRLALLAGVVPKSGKLPSAETRALVRAFYRDRARQSAA